MKELFFLLVLVSLSFCATGPIVQTTYGPIEGFTTSTNKVWLGIPFAAPPVGTLRWQPPQAPQSWSNVLLTNQFHQKALCPQINVPVNDSYGQSEDCLYMHVYAPLNASLSSSLPVYYYIWGGAFRTGSPHRYDAQFLAGQDVIVVVPSYRVGSFGFLAHPILSALNTLNTTGNYGIQDQRLGLQWVQDNIAAFGGNPNDVTIGGTSAGGGAVCMHLVSPLSAGLFHKAIIESGFCTNIPIPFATGHSRAEAVMANLGCNNGTDAEKIACLYAANASRIVAATTTRDSNPTQDYYELLETPISLVKKNQFNHVPLLIGNTLNESSVAYCASATLTPAQFVDNVQRVYPGNSAAILEAYDLDLWPNPTAAQIAVDSDVAFVCPAKSFEDAYSEKISDTYVFHFNHPPRYPSPGGSVACMGASHTFNIYFLFPSYYIYRMTVPYNTSTPLWTPEDTILANRMRTAWINFIQTGTPTLDPAQDIQWPKYNFTEGRFLAIDFDFYVGTHYQNDFCPVWGIPSPDLSCEDSITIIQTENTSWVNNGLTYTQQLVNVTTGDHAIDALELVIRFPGSDIQVGAVLESYWGVTRNDQGLFELNDYNLQNGLTFPAHTSFIFGYISTGSAAIVSVGIASCSA